MIQLPSVYSVAALKVLPGQLLFHLGIFFRGFSRKQWKTLSLRPCIYNIYIYNIYGQALHTGSPNENNNIGLRS